MKNYSIEIKQMDCLTVGRKNSLKNKERTTDMSKLIPIPSFHKEGRVGGQNQASLRLLDFF